MIQKVPCKTLRNILSNLQEVILGTKLTVLFLAIPLAIIANSYHYGRVSSLSLSRLVFFSKPEILSRNPN